MVITRFVLLAAFLLAASSVSAAVTIDLGPSDYKKFGPNAQHTGSGVRSSYGQTVRIPPAGGNLSVNRNAIVPYGSIANGLRGLARSTPGAIAASAAMSTIFIGLDWVFDQGEWKKLEEGWITDPDFVGWSGAVGSCTVTGPTPAAVCEGLVSSCAGREYARYTLNSSGDQAVCYGLIYGNENTVAVASRTGQCPEGSVFNSATGNCDVEGELITLTDADYSRIAGYLPTVDPELSAESASELQRRQGAPLPGYQADTITGPSTITGSETTSTSTDPVTGDTIVTTTNTTTNISYGDTTITTTDTTTSTTYTNGNHTSTETITETPGELPVADSGGAPPAGEWPGFCEWASVVCSFIEWFQEPFDAPEVEWPLIEDQDFEEEFNYTIAATCPEPYTIELSLFPPVQFNWQPFCDLASFIKPLVLASAAIFAAFISLGIARART